jgi:hypothetical protein
MKPTTSRISQPAALPDQIEIESIVDSIFFISPSAGLEQKEPVRLLLLG